MKRHNRRFSGSHCNERNTVPGFNRNSHQHAAVSLKRTHEGHMGAERVTSRNHKLVSMIRKIICWLSKAVPGPNGGYVKIALPKQKNKGGICAGINHIDIAYMIDKVQESLQVMSVFGGVVRHALIKQESCTVTITGTPPRNRKAWSVSPVLAKGTGNARMGQVHPYPRRCGWQAVVIFDMPKNMSSADSAILGANR
jgi:hypothetical protein